MFQPDQPIRSQKDDILGTAPFAEALGDAILSYGQEGSVVIALYGAWGSGKTSILNMALEHIDKVSKKKDNNKPIVMRFNPWYFSDQQQLISQFFDRLSNILSREDFSENLRKAGEKLKTYGKCFKPLGLIPTIGPILSLISEILKNAGDASKSLGELTAEDLYQTKGELNTLLAEGNRKIIVLIDDIDRLNNTEIRQIFQLVKSLADFANTVYLLAFDKEVVINALAKVQEGSGNDYLKKVVQVPFEMPQVSKEQILRLLRNQLDELIKDIPEERWDMNYWGNIYYGCLRHFFNSVRDVKRYINSLSFSFGQVKKELNPIDFIAITATQVFLPAVYYGIRDNKDIFAGVMSSSEPRDREQIKVRCDEIIERAVGFDKDALKELLRRLFPKLDAIYGNMYHDAYNWRKERRICDPETFDIFFRLSLPEGQIPMKEIETILSLANDKESFEKALLGLNEDGRVAKFLDRLEDYTKTDIPKENIENITAVLMNIGDLFPEVEEGFYSLGGTPMKILRIIHQLSERLESRQERFEVFKKAIDKADKSLYTVVHEVHALSWDHGKYTSHGPKAEEERSVDSDQLAQLEQLACAKIELWANDGRLQKSEHLQYILFAWKDWGKSEDIKKFVDKMIESDNGLIDFVNSFIGETRSLGMGDYIYRTEHRINLKTVEQFVDPKEIEPRVRNIFSSDEFEQMDDKKKLAVTTFLDTFDGKIKDRF